MYNTFKWMETSTWVLNYALAANNDKEKLSYLVYQYSYRFTMFGLVLNNAIVTVCSNEYICIL